MDSCRRPSLRHGFMNGRPAFEMRDKNQPGPACRGDVQPCAPYPVREPTAWVRRHAPRGPTPAGPRGVDQAGFRLALRDDGRSFALADADAAGDTHGNESGDECKQNLLHWNPLC